MSIEALNWAFKLRLPSSGGKLVLITLANYSNEDFEAFPSQKALAALTCLSERAVRENLAKLEELGVITRIPRTRANGSYTTDLFKLNISFVPQIEVIHAEIKDETQRKIQPTAESADGRIFQTQRQILPNPAAESAAPYTSLNTTITKSNPPARERALEAIIERGVPDKLAERWLLIREAKQAEVNQAALDLIQEEATLAGITFELAVQCCCDNVWSWFKAKWYMALPESAVRGTAHGPPAVSESGWRKTADGVLERGKELGVQPKTGESAQDYRSRVCKEDWKHTKQKAAAAFGEFRQVKSSRQQIAA